MDGLRCKRHKRIIGAAVIKSRDCLGCGKQVSSGCGGAPALCGDCSRKLGQCEYCTEPVENRTPE